MSLPDPEVELPERTEADELRSHTLNCRMKRGRAEPCTSFCNCECHGGPLD